MAKKDNAKAILRNVRLSYCNLLEPSSFDKEEPRYRTDVIIPKNDTKNIEAIKFAISEAIKGAQEPKGSLAGKDLKTAKANGKWHSALKDGDVERPEDEAYKNSYFISPWANKNWNDNGQQICDVREKPITKDTPDAGSKIYSGCYVTISVKFFGYENRGNMGTGCCLGAVLTYEKGEPLSGKTTAASEFADDIKEAQAEASLPDDSAVDASDDDLF